MKYLKRIESFFPDAEWKDEDEYELTTNDIVYFVENEFDLSITDLEAEMIMSKLNREKITERAKETTDAQIIYLNVSEEVLRQIKEQDLLTKVGVYKRADQEKFDL